MKDCNFTPCAMCTIRKCAKNRNQNTDARPLIEREKEEAKFKVEGCPHQR